LSDALVDVDLDVVVYIDVDLYLNLVATFDGSPPSK